MPARNTSAPTQLTPPQPTSQPSSHPTSQPLLRSPSDSGSFPNADTKLRSDYIRRVARLGAKLNKRPTQRQLREVARIRDDHTLRLFGNYAALFRAAGFRAQVRAAAIGTVSADDILADFRKLISDLGHFPTVSEYLKQGGGYSYNLIMKYFGAWWRVRLALENRSGHDSNWPLNPRTNSRTTPGATGDPLLSLPASHSGSDLAPRLNGLSMYAPHDDRPVCGTVLNYRAMLHEPTNEQGVVFLFGLLAEEMGFIIENVRTQYPDCEGKRRVGINSWQRVRIEFEFLSSRFDHPEDGCDLIICWRNDRPHPRIETISLEKYLNDRRALFVSETASPREGPGGGSAINPAPSTNIPESTPPEEATPAADPQSPLP